MKKRKCDKNYAYNFIVAIGTGYLSLSHSYSLFAIPRFKVSQI